jgi:FAD/FMN-containing dehydrogenase
MNVNLAKLSGGMTVIPDEMLDGLKARVRGTVLTERDDGYTAARSVWNAMIDRRPAIIVRCAGAADVREAVRFARDTGGVLSVRGGGHNIAGSAVCDGGIMINLSPMKSIRIDPVARTARVEPGVTLGEFDREAQSFGLVTPTGINSTTGIAGLTLGGGFGWISRKFGLTADNLLSADIVTADGQFVHASEDQPGSVLGDPRWRRQFRYCHFFRVPPAPARPGGHVGPHRVSAVRSNPNAEAVSRDHGSGAR